MPPKRSNTAEGLTARSMPYDLRHTSIPRVEPPPAAGQNQKGPSYPKEGTRTLPCDAEPGSSNPIVGNKSRSGSRSVSREPSLPTPRRSVSRQPSRQPSLPPPKRVRFSAREAPNPSDADAAEDEEELLAQRLFTTKERYNQFVSARKIAEARSINLLMAWNLKSSRVRLCIKYESGRGGAKQHDLEDFSIAAAEGVMIQLERQRSNFRKGQMVLLFEITVKTLPTQALIASSTHKGRRVYTVKPAAEYANYTKYGHLGASERASSSVTGATQRPS
ncbi:uncharacterized protein ATNIH1004_005453 [Aspergillus tanneri]|uniref:Uncharacterized protein n=1 Tax=Aspergillus tanneri TaxID=1220188 RepID=A0A5M9MIG2_9EURO|nr:uncharacterized protein ATNIH1004_005453 [Aspergillus tanneri]KAA8646778.1 hypothetical protein ATNIH1004_005453 [Aspergillus tanneri]